MPEHFKVVCIPCKALYKCSAFYYSDVMVWVPCAGPVTSVCPANAGFQIEVK